MKNLMYYEAKVKKVDIIKDEKGYIENYIVWVVPLYNNLGSYTEKRARTPSVIGTGVAGGGFLSVPTVGQKCLVIRDVNSTYDTILTYIPFADDNGYSGVLNPNNISEGGFELSTPGMPGNSIIVNPKSGITLSSSVNVMLSLSHKTETIKLKSSNLDISLKSGWIKYTTEKENKYTKEDNTNQFIFALSRVAESSLVGTDMNLDENSISQFPNPIYADKVILKAGNIYKKENIINPLLNTFNHLWELETRQSTIGVSKNILTMERRGYQKANFKNGADTLYPAGTLFELVTKKVNPLSIDSWLFRYGKLEAPTTGTEFEFTAGEIFRNQIYDNLVGYTFDSLNPLQKGKGWTYEFKNKAAGFQYTQSIGEIVAPDLILNTSFYREHIHSYTEHTVATKETPTGIEYSHILGGSSKNTLWGSVLSEKIVEDIAAGVPKLTYTETLQKKGSFRINLKDELQNEYEIIIGKGDLPTDKDGVTIKVKSATKTSKINIDVNTGNIIIDPGMGATPGSVYIGNSTVGQELVTKAWVDNIFSKHTHNTSQGITGFPIGMTMDITHKAITPFTYILKAE